MLKLIGEVTARTWILLTAPQVPLQIRKEPLDVLRVDSLTLKMRGLDPQFPDMLTCSARLR